MFGGQSYEILILVGFVFTAAGFLVRDELILRVFVLTGMCFDLMFFVLQSPPIWGPVTANSILVSINLVLITVIVLERSTLFMSGAARIAFENFKTLTPGQFRRINRIGTWKTAETEEVLLQEGEASDRLFFLEAPHFSISKRGQTYQAGGPAFAGEIMLLQGGHASATVTIPAGCIYVEWPAQKLRAAMRRSRPLENALVARFGHDLADKVRNSVPLG